jgi:hypothetical protein
MERPLPFFAVLGTNNKRSAFIEGPRKMGLFVMAFPKCSIQTTFFKSKLSNAESSLRKIRRTPIAIFGCG